MTGDDFRNAMRCFPTGVTIVTTVLDGRPKGFTANAFSSVSAEPPTILICVNRQGRSHPLISAAGKFCVNILRVEQRRLARRFADKIASDPFEELAYGSAATGAPVLDDVLAYFDCDLAEEHSAATHTIFVGTVRACAYRDGAPLGYFDAEYRDFGCLIRSS
ncbi:MAG: flavin reductase family protein [Candidatus Eremiobacteraeota bacterium]|nr:flavin reductase family protein [Candidatus Eremiobacteraeota bacterium]